MAHDNASSIAGSHIRVTRLDASGAPLVGPKNSYVTKAFVSVSMSPEYEDGDEFSQKNAGGEQCGYYKMPDTLKRVNLEIAICNPDPEFTELVSGGLLLSSTGEDNSVGWAAPLTGVDANPNGVAVEVWSRAIVNSRPAVVNPYWHWVFPQATLRQSGDRVIENDILATSFEGWAVGNPGFGDGPAAPLWPFTSDRAYAYARTTGTPVGEGYQAVVANNG